MSRLALLGVLFLSACDFSAPLRVLDEPRAVDRIDMIPAGVTISVGDTLRIEAVVRGRDSRALSEYDVTWSTGNPAALVNVAPGTFVATREASTEAFASAGGRRGISLVTIVR